MIGIAMCIPILFLCILFFQYLDCVENILVVLTVFQTRSNLSNGFFCTFYPESKRNMPPKHRKITSKYVFIQNTEYPILFFPLFFWKTTLSTDP